MTWWFLLTPFLGALVGWLLLSVATRMLFRPHYPKKIAGFSFHGIIPARQPEFADAIGRMSEELLPLKEIEEKITDPENVKKIMPRAEEHIDDFLRVKLLKSMPVVGMFVGDKTINNLKSLFITELEQLFPEIMKNYLGRLQEDFNIRQMVTAKINAIAPAAIEQSFLALMKKELRMAKMLGALLGFIIGCIQLAITLLLWQ